MREMWKVGYFPLYKGGLLYVWQRLSIGAIVIWVDRREKMFLSQTTLSHIFFKVMLYSRESELTWVLNRQNKAEYKGVHAYSGGQNY